MAATDPTEAAAARFSSAEARLYPVALQDPGLFERVTSLVALLGAEFGSCADRPAVVARCPEVLEALAGIASTAGISLEGLPVAMVVDAAAALRWRQLEAEQASDAVEERVQAALARGEQWLVEEPSPAMLMAGTVRRLELHLPTRATLVTTVEAGVDGREAEYGLELLPGRPEAGVTAMSATYADKAAWLAAADEVRARLCGAAPSGDAESGS